MIDNFEIEISQGYNIEELRQQWLLIQGSQDIPFFLTWSWISSWLETYNPNLTVISARYKDKIVAIGLFTCSTQARHGFVKARQYRLHQMGDPLLDQIWMEYNDFICVDEYREAAVNACLKALQESENKFDEIILSMISTSRAADIRKAINGSQVLLTNPCYAKNLDSIQGEDTQYISTLNSNTRYQIRHSIRLYEELHGKIEYKFAQNVAEALAMFKEAGEYHELRWEDSGFKNKQFVRFHENLIKNEIDKKGVDLMKITAGGVTIAILYFHLVGRNIYFYLQGINYESNKKLKPGLVAHTLATQHYLEKGMGKYNYMGGYSQYKCQLSDLDETLVTLCIQKPSVILGIENLSRKIKNMFKSVVKRTAV